MEPSDRLAPPDAWKKRGRVLRAAIIAAVVGFFLLTLRDGHHWGGDFSQYLHHAKNISTLRPYADTGYVFNPANAGIGPHAYPPLFPLSLSLTYLLFGLNLTAFKVQLVFVFAASLWVTARLFSGRLGEKRVLVYLLAMGFCPVFWTQKDSIASEHLFILLWYLTILVADQWYRQRRVYHSRWFHAVLLGLLIYSCYATKMAGIVLLPVVVACEILTTRRLTRFGLCAIATASGLMLLEKALLPASGAGYAAQIGTPDIGTLENLRAGLTRFFTVWENGYSNAARTAGAVLLSLAAVVGFARANLPRPSVLGVAVALYFGMIVFWGPGLRLVLPLLPAYVYYMLLGLDWPAIPPAARRWALACFCLFCGVSYASWYSRASYGAIEGVEARSATELFQYVRGHTQPGELCLFFRPRILCLYTDRRATAYPVGSDEAETCAYARDVGVSLVIVRHSGKRSGEWNSIDAEELAMTEPAAGLVEVWRNDAFRVFRGPCAPEQH